MQSKKNYLQNIPQNSTFFLPKVAPYSVLSPLHTIPCHSCYKLKYRKKPCAYHYDGFVWVLVIDYINFVLFCIYLFFLYLPWTWVLPYTFGSNCFLLVEYHQISLMKWVWLPLHFKFGDFKKKITLWLKNGSLPPQRFFIYFLDLCYYFL